MSISIEEAERDVQIMSSDAQEALNSGLHDCTVDAIHLTAQGTQDAPESMTMAIFEATYKEVAREAYHNIWLGYVEEEQMRNSNAPVTWRRLWSSVGPQPKQS